MTQGPAYVRRVGHAGLVPNGCIIVHSAVHNIIVSGEAIMSAENGGKPLGGRGSATNTGGGAYSAPQTP